MKLFLVWMLIVELVLLHKTLKRVKLDRDYDYLPENGKKYIYYARLAGCDSINLFNEKNFVIMLEKNLAEKNSKSRKNVVVISSNEKNISSRKDNITLKQSISKTSINNKSGSITKNNTNTTQVKNNSNAISKETNKDSKVTKIVNNSVQNTTKYNESITESVYELMSGNSCSLPNNSTKLYFSLKFQRLEMFTFKFKIFYDDFLKEVIISFSGPSIDSVRTFHYIQNIYFSGWHSIKEHKYKIEKEYYTIYFENIRKVLMQRILQVVKSGRGDYKYSFTGHSVGASIALLAAYDLVNLGTPQVYSFAALRIGDQNFIRLVDYELSVFRINKIDDFVPRLPICRLEIEEQSQTRPFISSQIATTFRELLNPKQITLNKNNSISVNITNTSKARKDLENESKEKKKHSFLYLKSHRKHKADDFQEMLETEDIENDSKLLSNLNNPIKNQEFIRNTLSFIDPQVNPVEKKEKNEIICFSRLSLNRDILKHTIERKSKLYFLKYLSDHHKYNENKEVNRLTRTKRKVSFHKRANGLNNLVDALYYSQPYGTLILYNGEMTKYKVCDVKKNIPTCERFIEVPSSLDSFTTHNQFFNVHFK